MPLHKYFERIRFIDSLIRRRATGNAETLGKKLGISISLAFNLINELKDEGFPIAFSKEDNSYYYTKEGKLVNRLFENELSSTDMKAITGGKSFLLPESNYASFSAIRNASKMANKDA